MKLDVKDQKILHAMEFNARAPIAEIAKQVRLSKEVTNYRIKRLEKEGILEGYQTIYNLFNIGRDYYTLLFHIKNFYSIEKDIVAYLRSVGNCSRIFVCDGDFNLILNLRAGTMQDLYNSIRGFLDRFGESIEKNHMMFSNEIFLSRSYFLYDNITKDPREIVDIKRTQNPSSAYDKMCSAEKNLLSKLLLNPKAMLKDVSQELNIDIKTTKKYINKLKNDNLIMFYRANLNVDKLGFKRFLVSLSFRDLSAKNNEVIEYLKHSRNITGIYHSFGMADIFFEAIVGSMDDMYEFLRGLNIKYADRIKRHSVMPVIHRYINAGAKSI